MDRRELIEDFQLTLINFLSGWQKELWTALPAIIQSFDPVAMTCTAKPTVRIPIQQGSDPVQWVEIPLLLDVPVFFPSGGGYTLTFPVTAGDEALIVFASRCIDGWFGTGEISDLPYLRLHDLSDGFAFVGFRSSPKTIANVSTTSIQLRNNAGNNLVEIKNGGIININSTAQVNVNTVSAKVIASGTAEVTAPAIALNGNVTIAGSLTMTGGGTADLGASSLTTTGDVTAGGKSLKTHVHSGVTTGISNTGAPV